MTSTRAILLHCATGKTIGAKENPELGDGMAGKNRDEDPKNAYGVYTTQKTLRNLLTGGRAESGEHNHWEFKRMPIWATPMTDFWIAFDDHWQGFFHVEEVDPKRKTITFHSNSWHQLLQPVVPRKPFAGVTYRVPSGSLLTICRGALEIVGAYEWGGGHRRFTPFDDTAVDTQGASLFRTISDHVNALMAAHTERIMNTITSSHNIQIRQLNGIAFSIGFFQMAQFVLSRVGEVNSEDLKRVVLDTLEKLYGKDEVEKHRKEVDDLLNRIEKASRIVYQSTPDSKKDVA